MTTPSHPQTDIAWYARLWRREAGVPAGLFAVTSLLLGFAMLTAGVLNGGTHRLDEAVVAALRNPADPGRPIGPPFLVEMGRDITALGSFAVLGLIFLASLFYLLLQDRKALALLMSVAVLGGVTISTVMKMVIDRPRPDAGAVMVFTASFPSGHAMLSAVVFLTLGVLLARASRQRRVKVYLVSVAVLMTVLVGASRVYLGVHYPSDVVAGWCLGTAWAVLCWIVAWRLRRSP